MFNHSPQNRDKLLEQAQHLRQIAAEQLDARLRDAAQELAEEYEQRAAEADQKNEG